MRAICRTPASVYLIAAGLLGPTGIYICSEYRGRNVERRELSWNLLLGYYIENPDWKIRRFSVVFSSIFEKNLWSSFQTTSDIDSFDFSIIFVGCSFKSRYVLIFELIFHSFFKLSQIVFQLTKINYHQHWKCYL